MRFLRALTLIAVLGLGFFWWATAPHPLPASEIPQHQANLENGKLLYNVGGCISCHASLADATVPSGGKALKTPIGIFYPPNLTPDKETGLGNWSDVDFVNAMQRGLAPDGAHLIPAFPYTSYAHMKIEDVLDIKAYLSSLPAVNNKTKPQEIVALPIIRRGIGLWQMIWLFDPQQQYGTFPPIDLNRGAYLVNGPGHCNECHTPRNLFMASDFSRKLMGGPHPEGKGKVPSLHGLVERERYKDAADLVSAFQNGEALGYEHMSSGGMGDVRRNLEKLPEADLKAIAEYVLSFK